ncbi:hypothetical protein ACLB2K_005829 [Fragaria x ananassa]
MKQQQIIERIEKNSVAASTGKGPPPVQVLRLGAVFQTLFDAAVQVKGKNSKFKRFLEDFKFTLDCLKPLVQEIVECNKVLNFPKEEILEDFMVHLGKGVELVYKCSKCSLWNRFKRFKYINSLFELDESLQRLFNKLRLQIETDMKEALDPVSKLEMEIEEIEASFVLQHHQYESAAAEPQLPKVEVDVMNMQVTRDVMESMDSTGNVEVGDESHKRTEGSSLASHQIDVAVEEEEEEQEEEREPLSPTILAGITELFDSALARSNMEVGDEQTVGQGEEAAVRRFEEEVEAGLERKGCVRILQELRAFKAAGDPFREEFFLTISGSFKRTCIYVADIAMMSAAITAPPLVTALARPLAVSVGSVENWCKILWSYYETLKAHRIAMQLGTMDCMFTMTDLNKIRVLVEKCESEIEALLQNADFAIKENAVKKVMSEINKKLEMFMETVKSLSQNADECGRNIRRARTVILQRIICHPIK